MNARYSFGGDEHLFIEMSDSMSLEAFFRALALCNAVRESRINGVNEICPANASMLLKFDPDIIAPADLLAEVKALEGRSANTLTSLKTRILEIPVYYDDPWSRETLMRFRDRHQDPNATDLEYAARMNGLGSVEEFVEAHSGTPWFVSMVGFVAGCPFMFQMAEQAKQLQVPKYVRPRTDTPRLTVGQGGCFTAIYPVRGAGGYQCFGITPIPIYDPQQRAHHLRDFMILFRTGDIVKLKPVSRDVYDLLVDEVERGEFRLKQRDVSFSLSEFRKAPAAYNRDLVEALNGL